MHPVESSLPSQEPGGLSTTRAYLGRFRQHFAGEAKGKDTKSTDWLLDMQSTQEKMR
jgi:hypothetical protein